MDVANSVSLDPVVPNLVGLDCMSHVFDVVGWQTLFKESNLNLLPPSPSLAIPLFDCVLESSNPTCIILCLKVVLFLKFL